MTRTLYTLMGLLLLSVLFIQNSEAAPSTGTIQVAFILSELEDQAYQDDHDQDYFEDLAFGDTDSMWDYFDEVSRSQLNVQGTVYGPYTLDGDAADYGTENSEFVRDSVEIAEDELAQGRRLRNFIDLSVRSALLPGTLAGQDLAVIRATGFDPRRLRHRSLARGPISMINLWWTAQRGRY